MAKKNKFNVGVIIIIVIAALVAFFVGKKVGQNGHNHDSTQESAEGNKPKKKITWTCSMHPSVKLPEPVPCPICFMDLIPLEEGADNDPNSAKISFSEAAVQLANIVTEPAVRKKVNADIKLVGKVDFDETRMENITSRINGRIDRLYIDYTGDTVRKGEAVAQIYSPELLTLQKELLLAYRAFKKLPDNSSPSLKNSVQSTLLSAKEKLRLLGFSEKELQENMEAGKVSDHVTIYAKQHGVVVDRKVHEGDYVKIGTPLFLIVDMNQMWIKLEVYEADLAWIKKGQHVEFTVEAYPGETFMGKVAFIDPIVNRKTRTVMVRVNAPNRKNRLKADMFVKATVKTDRNKTNGNELPLLIPASAPLITGDRAVVYVRLEDQKKKEDEGKPKKILFEGKTVTLGAKVGKYFIVKSGLNEGDNVVVNGAFKIDGELQIKAKPSMMNPLGSNEKKHIFTDALISNENKIKLPTDVEAFVNTFFEHYLTLNDALAGDNFKKSQVTLKKMNEHFQKIPNASGKDLRMLRNSLDELKKRLSKHDKLRNINEARTLYEHISFHTIKIGNHYENSVSVDMNITFCPMAFDNKGAYWLQKQAVVNNPYYGSQMLKCGSIEGVIESTNDKAVRKRQSTKKAKTAEKKIPIKVNNPSSSKVASFIDKYLPVYLDLNDALAADDYQGSVKQIIALKGLFDKNTIKDDAVFVGAIEAMKKSLGKVSSMEDARTAYKTVSNKTIELVKHYGHSLPHTVNLTYCPMAFNNTGGYWLQRQDVVNNPYWGAKMLKCGSVKEKIERRKAVTTENRSEKNSSAIDVIAIPTTFNDALAEKKTTEYIHPRIRTFLEKFYAVYLDVNDALAGDNYNESVKQLEKMNKLLQDTNFKKAKANAYINTSINDLKKHLKRLSDVKEMALARMIYKDVSIRAISLLKYYGHHQNGNVNVTYCPMAFDNTGAYWLQRQDVVNNPYWGAMMLKCGSVKESLDAEKK